VTWPPMTRRDTRSGYNDGRLPWRTMADLLTDRDDLPDWAHKHPSTTIVGSYRPECVAPPTYRRPGDGPRQNQPGVVRTSVKERLRIQGFPEGWQTAGPATARGLQVGNAIPPTLARVALSAALDGWIV
jgi:site-specific DNA-cytosine methylase